MNFSCKQRLRATKHVNRGEQLFYGGVEHSSNNSKASLHSVWLAITNAIRGSIPYLTKVGNEEVYGCEEFM